VRFLSPKSAGGISMVSNLQTASAILWGAALLSSAGSSAFLRKNRNKQPCKGRLANLIIFGNIISIASVIPFWVGAPYGFAVGDWLLRIGLGCVYFARFFSLWIRFQIAEGKIKGIEEFRLKAKERRREKGGELGHSPSSPRNAAAVFAGGANPGTPKTMRNWERYKYLISARWIMSGICGVLAIFSIWPIVLGALDPQCSSCVSRDYSIAMLIVEIALVSCIGVFALRIDKKHDNFGLMPEFWMSSCCWLLLSTLTLLLSLSPDLSTTDIFLEMRRLLVAVFILSVSFVSSWIPVYLSRNRSASSKANDNPSIATFEGVLENETAREEFREFLKGEFCVENLLFYE
jgi:hypothetical protein